MGPFECAVNGLSERYKDPPIAGVYAAVLKKALGGCPVEDMEALLDSFSLSGPISKRSVLAFLMHKGMLFAVGPPGREVYRTTDKGMRALGQYEEQL